MWPSVGGERGREGTPIGQENAWAGPLTQRERVGMERSRSGQMGKMMQEEEPIELTRSRKQSRRSKGTEAWEISSFPPQRRRSKSHT